MIGSTDRDSSANEAFTVWDIYSGDYLFQIETGNIIDLTWSPNGEWIATMESNVGIKLWDSANGNLIKQFPIKGSDIDWSPDSKYLAIATPDLIVVDVISGEYAFEFEYYVRIGDVVWSPDGSFILGALRTGESDIAEGGFLIWDFQNKQLLRKISFRGSSLLPIWSPNGDLLTAYDKKMIWDVNTGVDVFRNDSLFGVKTWSPDGSILAIAFGDRLTFWGISTGE